MIDGIGVGDRADEPRLRSVPRNGFKYLGLKKQSRAMRDQQDFNAQRKKSLEILTGRPDTIRPIMVLEKHG